jgi:hypothetical protein
MKCKCKIFIFLISLLSASTCFADMFSTCRFHFGCSSDKVTTAILAQIDYITVWAGSEESYNLSSYFSTCISNGKTPVLIGYIVAFTARRDLSLQDCNVDTTNNLCKKGADYIRQNRTRILSQYAKYAKGAHKSDSTQSIVWCMEPDYVQYADSTTQNNKGLSFAECGSLMNEIIDTIKKNCPNSVFSMDISPWKDTTWQKKWFSCFKMGNFIFINTSGGSSRADQIYISDNWSTALPTWSWVYKTYGTPLLADAGYGAGGSSTGYDSRWDSVPNLVSRINDGVLGVSQYTPNSAWATTINSERSQLPTPPKCPSPTSIESAYNTKSNLTLNYFSNGLVEIIDISGRTLFAKKFSSREHFTLKDIKGSPALIPGAYFIKLSGNNECVQKRIILTK